MDTNRAMIISLCGLAMLAAVGCGGPTVHLAVDRHVPLPPEIAELTRGIAVLPIPCTENMAYGDMLAAELQSQLFAALKPHPTHPQLKPSEAVAIAMEQAKVNRIDCDKPDSGLAVARRADADASIFGRVSIVIREVYREARSPIPVVGGLLPSRQVAEGSAVVTATLSMVSVKTGAIMQPKSILKRQSWLGTPEKTAEEAIRQCVREFVESIVPPSLRAVYELKLAESGDEDVKAGNIYAKMCNCKDAAERFEAAVRKNPENHAALYNLGLMRMFLNTREEAANCFQKALALKVDGNYVWAQEVLRQIKPDETPRKAEKHEVEKGRVINKP